MSVALLAFTACGWGDEDATEAEVVALSCAEGQSSYQVAETPIQFCYDPAWGEPSVTDVAAEVGVLKVVAFAGYEGGPEVRYQSGDYEGEGICMSCLNTSQPDDGLMTQMIEQLGLSADQLHVRKGDVGGQVAIRVNNKSAGVLSYYVPFAFEGHHVTVSADNDNAANLDDFVWAMQL